MLLWNVLQQTFCNFLTQLSKLGFWVAGCGIAINFKLWKGILRFSNFLRSKVLSRLPTREVTRIFTFNDNNLVLVQLGSSKKSTKILSMIVPQCLWLPNLTGWLVEVTWHIGYFLSPLALDQWPQNMAKWWLSIGSFNP